MDVFVGDVRVGGNLRMPVRPDTLGTEFPVTLSLSLTLSFIVTSINAVELSAQSTDGEIFIQGCNESGIQNSNFDFTSSCFRSEPGLPDKEEESISFDRKHGFVNPVGVTKNRVLH